MKNIKFKVHQRELDSVFQLLGSKENDMTYSFGWALKSSKTFLEKFLLKVGISKDQLVESEILISLQEHKQKTHGFTDIEIVITGKKSAHIIIEAKRGWDLVSQEQIEKYVHAADEYDTLNKKTVIVLTNYDEKRIVSSGLHHGKVGDYNVQYVSWKNVLRLCQNAFKETRGQQEKWVLRDLENYLKGIVVMRDVKSNMVYSCVVTDDTFCSANVTFKDVIDRGFYFHPIGKGYSHVPHNYMAFRYKGLTDKIYYVREVQDFSNYEDAFKLMKWKVDLKSKDETDPHFLYFLDECSIEINPPIRNGKIHAAGTYSNIMLDTLITSGSIGEALRKTKQRLELSHAA